MGKALCAGRWLRLRDAFLALAPVHCRETPAESRQHLVGPARFAGVENYSMFMCRILVVVLILLVSATSFSRAEEPRRIEIDLVPEGFNQESEGDRTLLAWCYGALLRDRGLTYSRLQGHGGIDRWIVDKLATNPDFLKAVDAAPRPKLPGEIRWLSSQPSTPTDRKLFEVFAGERTEKLLLVYLHVEGPMALRRSEFATLFEKEETQRSIAALVKEKQSKGERFYGAMFFSQEPAVDAHCNVQLRAISYELDCQIVRSLSKVERERLVSLLASSEEVARLAIGPPPL